jgi:hypothetical protein
LAGVSGDCLVREIHDLHDDLGRWLGSEAAPEVFTRIVEQHHPDFSMVTVDGGVVPLAQLTERLRVARNTAPRLTIQVVEVDVLAAGAQYAAARFRERHSGERSFEERLTTAVLVADADARNGWRWRAVHETRTGDASV